MGGGGRRIVYDEAAIEALLDRSGLEKGTVCCVCSRFATEMMAYMPNAIVTAGPIFRLHSSPMR